MSRLKTAMLAVALAGVSPGGIAVAQTAPLFDPDQLPAVQGTVAQYLPTPHGDVDGLLLADGTQIHLPPHLSTQIVFAVKLGDSVTVHGLKARALKLMAAASVTNDTTHVTVAWSGALRPGEESQIEAQGVVKMPLYGPRGEANGLLLADGTVVHLPPPEVERLADTIAVGKWVIVRGEGYSGPLGRALDARQIGPDAAHLIAVAGPRPPGREMWWREHMKPGMMDRGLRDLPDGDDVPLPPQPTPR